MMVAALGAFMSVFGRQLGASKMYVNLVPGFDTVIQTKSLPRSFTLYPNVDDIQAFVCSEYEPIEKKTTFSLVKFSEVLNRFEF